ncbi:hypothetical protein BJF93_22590 [Xaviernesmea oryzae]|uniref:Enterobactin synthase component D n=1 Tax=Xaviernesmea oryzae TaxID=464029 RepID=A0A1Q9B366_9HYPH|nr:4'-phosphopantetheinyl transferase superfamily protein [Xaviernesmea oryzae]OLP62452.1 hypothetical protein BJF93_22590 [Xaviernesmea oryzae]SEM16857.1 4'-phosphopantetheinyl transferase EntD (siderophore biosynthesis) [Xaviernesmea oryzae]
MSETDGAAEEAALRQALGLFAPPGIRLGCRMIRSDDARLLTAEEAEAFAARPLAARRASGAARATARALLAAEGLGEAFIGRAPTGAPVWPEGFVGSLAHDEAMAVAAIAPKARVRSLGIDVEPAAPLEAEVAALVHIAEDVIDGVEAGLAARVLFSAKEAVYKACFPLDGIMLDYADITVDLRQTCAITSTGRHTQLFVCLAPRLVVLAVIEPA